MERITLATVALAGCMLLFLPRAADATSSYRNAWNNDYPDVCSALSDLSCSICHTEAPALNPYGQDIAGTDGPSIENLDSDGDGYTNGQEILVDCTDPADATDHGTVPGTATAWGAVKTLFR